MCCSRIAENTGRKNSPSAHNRTTLSGYIFATKAHIDNRKKLLNSNISSTCPHNTVNLGPLTAEIGRRVWGTTANSNGLASLYCTDVAEQRSAKLCRMFGRLLGWHTIAYIHFWGRLLPLTNFTRCKDFLRFD